MGDVVNLAGKRKSKEAHQATKADVERYKSMDKLELLEEMVKFQEERSSLGYLTVEMMIRGKELFRALEESAETPELQLLTRSYRRHLDYELTAYLKETK